MIWPPYLLAAVVALGLVVWAGFYMLGMPLNPAEAVVMVGLCGAIAYGLNALVRRLLHKRAPPHAHPHPHPHAGTEPHAHKGRAKAKPGGRSKKRRH